MHACRYTYTYVHIHVHIRIHVHVHIHVHVCRSWMSSLVSFRTATMTSKVVPRIRLTSSQSRSTSLWGSQAGMSIFPTNIPNKWGLGHGATNRVSQASLGLLLLGSNAVSSQGGLGIHCSNLLGLFWEYVGPISLGNKKAHKESPSCNLQRVALSVARKASIPHAFSVRKLSKQCFLYAPFVPAFHVFRISKKPCL